MATLADIEELATKNRLLDVEEREITIGFQRHNEQEVYRLVSSFLIGGMTQQGKSVIAAYLACQFVLAGSRLLLLDPHCSNKKRGLTHKIEPLREWFALPPVDFSDIDEVIERFAWLGQEYTRRKQPGGMKNAFPLLCLIDEFNEFLTGCGLSKQQKAFVSQVVSNVARGGAKHGLFVGIILHNADVSKSGGSEVRYNITTRIAVNCESREQCKILDYDDKGHIEEQCASPLQPGDALVKLPGYPPYVFTWGKAT